MTDKENTKVKIKAIYPHIVVGGDIDKPYYTIHWYDIEQKTMICGFGSYKLELVRKWLEEEFEIVESDIDNLIKQQQAEIKRLKEEVASKSLKCSLLEREKAEDISGFVDDLKLVRTEAIKELQDKLVERFEQLEHSPQTNRKTLRIEEVNAIVNTVLQVGVPDIIRKVVKEMVGEQE